MVTTQLPDEELGRRIKMVRTYAGLTLDELAEKVNLHRTTIAAYQAGRHFPRPLAKKQRVLEEIAEATGTSIELLTQERL